MLSLLNLCEIAEQQLYQQEKLQSLLTDINNISDISTKKLYNVVYKLAIKQTIPNIEYMVYILEIIKDGLLEGKCKPWKIILGAIGYMENGGYYYYRVMQYEIIPKYKIGLMIRRNTYNKQLISKSIIQVSKKKR